VVVDSEELAEDLQQLEIKLKILKRDYEFYFNGVEKREPLRVKEQAQKIIRKYFNERIMNVGLRFKFQSLVATFNTFNNYWMRTMLQIENGTYQKDRFKAEIREKNVLNSTGTNIPGRAGEKTQEDKYLEIYRDFLNARETSKEGTNISYDGLKKILLERSQDIKEKYQCDDVKFKVTLENGKAKLRGFPVTHKSS
jgi:hypothetical protein